MTTLVRLIAVAVFAFSALESSAVRADVDPTERISAGTSVAFAAELGTTRDVLGRGFERNLSPDVGGERKRVFPAKSTDVDANEYKARFEVVDNSFLLDAHGHYLFAEAGVKASTSKRYMVLRAYQVSKVAKLTQEGKPSEHAPMYASKIFYGWALYVVIEGDASSFTTKVAAELGAGGGDLKLTMQKNKLTARVHLIGLTPKQPDEIPVAVELSEVLKKFQPSKDPQPIFVEYTLMDDVTSTKIDWTQQAGPAPAQVRQRQLVVRGKNSDWTETAVTVGTGDMVVGIAMGKVRFSNWQDPVESDAKGSGGLISRIGTQEGQAGKNWVQVNTGAPGLLKLKVRDNGYGDNSGQYDVVFFVIPAASLSNSDCAKLAEDGSSSPCM